MSCAEMEDLIDELALDVLPGDLRGLALEHLEGCSSCRGRVEELSESADQLLFAYRPTQPPAGFEARVLNRLEAERLRGSGRPRRRSWRVTVAVAAAAAAIVGLALGPGSLFPGGTRSTTHVAAPRGSVLRTVALISSEGSSDGQPIGDVSAYGGSPAWFFLRVNHGTESDTYQCVLDIAGGRSLWIGPMVISRGEGGWGEHVNVDARAVVAARLVDDTGRTVATAAFR
jgi:hypothetical protein